jgi:predicted DNA-binding ribbon-helix-helix protein
MKRFQSPCLHHVRINGRDTSITVEPEFWKQFRLMTMERQTTIGKPLAEIDRLSSGMTMRTRRRLARLSAPQRR